MLPRQVGDMARPASFTSPSSLCGLSLSPIVHTPTRASHCSVRDPCGLLQVKKAKS